MKYLAWVALTYLLLALLSPLLGRLDAQLYAPDVALISALYLGSRLETGPAVLMAFVVGLLKDGFSLSAPVGVYTEIAVLVALIGRFLQARVDLVSPLPVMASSAAISLLASGLFLAFESVFHRAFDAYGEVLTTALPLALTTMLVSPLQFWLMERIRRRLDSHAHGNLLLRR
ncbi:MAG: hypothetical protein HY902_15205 [Deltaproteobacteria bacterium]|nr:hypothetical protein [Deltaproteobacteria bacterium]